MNFSKIEFVSVYLSKKERKRKKEKERKKERKKKKERKAQTISRCM